MHCTARFVCAAWLVAAAACSDDGLNVQDLNSSSTATAAGESSGNPTGPVTTADDHGATAGSTGTTPTDSTGATGSTSFSETTVNDNDGTTIETSMGESSSGTTDGSTTDGSTTDGSTTGGSTTEACEPITEDPSGIGLECQSNLDCLPGYTCQPFEGFAFQITCQILCEEDCDCPMGYTCTEIADKSGAVWHQCV
jgi:hypothetical protein